MSNGATKPANRMGKSVMQIGDLAQLAGISVRAIRYYEELGLIQPESHSSGGFRLYGSDNFKRLQVISFMKELGLTLDEIRRIFLAKKTMGAEKATVQFLTGVLGEKIALLDSKIAALNALKSELGRALQILRSCGACQRQVLLDATSCGDCDNLTPREDVPDTFEVILQ